MLRLEALPAGFVYRGSTDVSETERMTFLPQLSFTRRLGFRGYDGCQTPVTSCEDIEGREFAGMDLDQGQWHWQRI